ncbi:hypothetical protein AB1339_22190 [Streptomyces cyaneofuscatus]|uniref:hypothetical protein n=1 Tax=Streptomyces cyaneofuscatus TaxID=66883 RepID=UPI00345D53F8
MSPHQVRNTPAPISARGTHFRTLAYGTDSRNSQLILLGVILSCVINGDSVTGILRQATWLVATLVVLIIVQIVQSRVAWSSAPYGHGAHLL